MHRDLPRHAAVHILIALLFTPAFACDQSQTEAPQDDVTLPDVSEETPSDASTDSGTSLQVRLPVDALILSTIEFDSIEPDVFEGRIGLTEPLDGQLVSGVVAIRASIAEGEDSPVGVRFFAGTRELRFDTAAPFNAVWPSPNDESVEEELRAQAEWSDGSVAEDSVTVRVDPTPPALSIIRPFANSTVSRVLPVHVEVSDRSETAIVIEIDGTELLREQGSRLQTDVSVSGLTSGRHVLSITAIDEAANETSAELDFYLCSGGFVGCDGACQSPEYFQGMNNCGACSQQCTYSAQLCASNGTCDCAVGFRLCDGVCTPERGNPSHCGECGNACPSGTACVDDACSPMSSDMVYVPPGSFQMGSPEFEPARIATETLVPVTLSRGFLMDRTEVTQGMWTSEIGSNPSFYPECGDDCPIDSMTWWSVISYANARSVRDGFPPCYELVDCNEESPASRLECSEVVVLTPSGSVLDCEGYRLPTEAEWEYAYRAGTSTGYYSGEVQGGGCEPYRPLDEIAWYCATTDSRPHPVAQKVPNAWGLYDMAGNAFEWTWSFYGRIPDGPLVDWEGPSSGGDRTMRGGSFNEMAGRQRAATRLSENPAGGRRWLGFRLVRSLP